MAKTANLTLKGYSQATASGLFGGVTQVAPCGLTNTMDDNFTL